MNPSDVLSSLLLMFIAGLLLFILHRFWRLRPEPHRTILWDVIFMVAMGHVFLFMFLPAILRLLTDWHSDTEVFVRPSEVMFVYTIEFVSFLTWAAVVSTTGTTPRQSQVDRHAPAESTERVFASLVMLVGIAMSIDSLVNRTLVQSNQFGDLESASITAKYLWPLTPLCLASGSVFGGYILARGRKAFGDVAYFSAALGAAIYAITYGLTGVRGALMWPVLWVMLVDRAYHPRVWWRRAPLAAAVLAVALLQSSVLTLRNVGSDASVTDRIEQLRNASNEQSDLLSSAEFRLGAASRYSVGFVRMWDEGHEAGWNPILNTLSAPIPRLFLPDKPVPTSRDGDRYSTGMYLIVSEIEHGHSLSMSEFLTGAHAYWEFGWVGVIVLSAIAGVYVRFSAWFASKFGHAAPCILFLFFKPWGYNNPKLWVSDAMLEVAQLVPPVLFFWFLARVVTSLGRALPGAAGPTAPETGRGAGLEQDLNKT
jgi:hypothetical protein